MGSSELATFYRSIGHKHLLGREKTYRTRSLCSVNMVHVYLRNKRNDIAYHSELTQALRRMLVNTVASDMFPTRKTRTFRLNPNWCETTLNIAENRETTVVCLRTHFFQWMCSFNIISTHQQKSNHILFFQIHYLLFRTSSIMELRGIILQTWCKNFTGLIFFHLTTKEEKYDIFYFIGKNKHNWRPQNECSEDSKSSNLCDLLLSD